MANNDKRERVTAICATLPGAEHQNQGDHTIHRVRGKVFAYFLDDHHGDGRVALNCKGSAATHDMLEQLAPAQFHIPKYLGNKGWIGLWLDVPKMNWSAVELAVREAYRLAAPKTLTRELA